MKITVAKHWLFMNMMGSYTRYKVATVHVMD